MSFSKFIEGIEKSLESMDEACEKWLKHRKHRRFHEECPKLAFNISINNKNFNCMAILSSLTLTSVAPVDLFLTVVDANNNNAVIPGTYSAVTYTPADIKQDVAVADATNPVNVAIHAVADQGGTSIVASVAFVSTSQNTDGTPKVSATLTSTLTVVNNIVVAVLNPTLVFNQ